MNIRHVLKKQVTCGLFVMLTTGLFSGCTTAPPPVPQPDYSAFKGLRPTVAAVYYPFGPAFSNRIARPVPDYNGWPQERMQRDLRTMASGGVDVALTVVDPHKFDELHRKSYERFFRIAGRHPDTYPKVALLLQTKVYKESDTERLLSWAVEIRNDSTCRRAWWRQSGSPLILLGEGMKESTARHPAFTFIRTHQDGGQWSLTPHPPGEVAMQTPGKQVTVVPGWYRNDSGTEIDPWKVPRKNGATLRYALWSAFRLRPEILILRSWNNFANGTFIEPNTLDGEKTLEILRKELQKAGVISAKQK